MQTKSIRSILEKVQTALSHFLSLMGKTKQLTMKKTFTLLIGSLLLFAFNTFGQSNITGKVVDNQTGDPLPGSSVRLEGTNKGTIAGVDGSFVIANVEAGDYSIAISYVGYRPSGRVVVIYRQSPSIICISVV